MTNVMIRNVPEDVHSSLVRRASQAGQSLQSYLMSELVRLAQVPTNDELFARIKARGGTGRVGFDKAVAALEEERHER
jgi:plasmid stability protein